MVEVRAITDRATWLSWRAHDLTASDIGAVYGVDPYRTALSVWGEKTGRIQPGIETNIMRRGRWLEAATLEAIREELPDWRIERAKVYLSDPELRLGATPDVLAEDPDDPSQLVNIQMKAVSRPVFERDWPGETVPLHIALQTLTEGMLTGAVTNKVAALVIDTYSAELVLRDVPRHAGAEAQIRHIANHFWQMIAAGMRPAPDYAADGETIRALTSHVEQGKTIDLTGDNRIGAVLEQRAALKALIKRQSEAADALDAEIRLKLGDAEIALLPGWKITNKVVEKDAYTVAASSGRSLRVYPQKETTP